MRPDRVVRLRDGREVSSSSEEWRAECEARYVAKLPDREARRGYLSRVEAKRGADARKALERAAREIFDAEVAPVLRAALAAKKERNGSYCT
jgi:hypothetical protein